MKDKLIAALAVAVLLLFSCGDSSGPPTLTENLKKQVAERIRLGLKYPDSYSPASWDGPDTLYNTISTDPGYVRLAKAYDSIKAITDTLMPDMYHPGRFESMNEAREDLYNRKTMWMINAPREVVGWWVMHKFMANDSAGLPDTYSYNIHFDKEMKITGVEDVSDIPTTVEEAFKAR